MGNNKARFNNKRRKNKEKKVLKAIRRDLILIPAPNPKEPIFVYPTVDIPKEFLKITNRQFHNITNIIPSDDIKMSMALGPSFIFSTPDATNDEIMLGIDILERNHRCKAFFATIDKGTDNTNNTFRVPNPLWMPPKVDNDLEEYLKDSRAKVINQLALIPHVVKPRSWSDILVDSIKNMCNFYNAMIVRTDKGLGFILLYKSQYYRMIFEHLNTTSCYTLQSDVYIREHNYPNPNHPLHKLNDTTSTKKSSIITSIYTKLKYILLKYNMLFQPDKYNSINDRPQLQLIRLNNTIFQTVKINGIQTKLYYATPTPIKFESLTDIAKYMLRLEYTNLTRISCMHIYPKIHKPHATPDDIKGRPIVSSINSPTYWPSKYLDKILQPLIKILPTNLKDTMTLMLLLNNRQFSNDIFFLTADVSALYPSIDINDALIEIRLLLLDNLYKNIDKLKTITDVDMIIDLMELVLNENYVEFGDRMWLQIQGTAMGTPFAVVFANLYMTALHLKCLKLCNTMKYINPFAYCYPPLNSDKYKKQLEFFIDPEDLCFRLSDKSKLDYPDLLESDLTAPVDYEYEPYSDPLEFQRFIDDIFSLWNDCYSALIYITILNTLRPTIKLTYDISYDFGIMMDMKVFKGYNFYDDSFDDEEGQLDFELYQKETNLFQHLPYQSYHESYKSIITAERTRYCLLCSSPITFDLKDTSYRQQLIDRGYPDVLLKKWFSIKLNRNELITQLIYKRENPKNKELDMLILPTLRCERNTALKFHNLYKIPSSLRNKISDKYGKKVFHSRIMISKKYGKNLADLFCSSKVKATFTNIDIDKYK
jgi:hypothetical protein